MPLGLFANFQLETPAPDVLRTQRAGFLFTFPLLEAKAKGKRKVHVAVGTRLQSLSLRMCAVSAAAILLTC